MTTTKAIIDVGAQHLGTPRILVMSAGADEASTWADLRVGEGRQWEDVRLRANQPHELADGTFLTLVAVAPPPHTRRIALEISTPDEAATR